MSHLTVVVRDPGDVRRFLVDVCGGRVFAEDENIELGTRSAWVTLGTETTVVELAVPRSIARPTGALPEKNRVRRAARASSRRCISGASIGAL